MSQTVHLRKDSSQYSYMYKRFISIRTRHLNLRYTLSCYLLTMKYTRDLKIFIFNLSNIILYEIYCTE